MSHSNFINYYSNCTHDSNALNGQLNGHKESKHAPWFTSWWSIGLLVLIGVVGTIYDSIILIGIAWGCLLALLPFIPCDEGIYGVYARRMEAEEKNEKRKDFFIKLTRKSFSTNTSLL